MKKLKWLICFSTALFLIGCAAARKAELTAGDDIYGAVTEVSELVRTAQAKHADLLSAGEFDDGVEYAERAQQALASGGAGQTVLDNAGIAKAYLQEAIANADSRRANATGIIRVRQQAQDAGLARSDRLRAKLAEVDERLADATETFSASLNPEQFSEFQKRYYDLEIEAVQFSELGAVRQAIRNANADDAEELAPGTREKALLDLGQAENLIAQSPRDPAVYRSAVDASVESAILLADVMEVITNAEGTPENVALKVVEQNRELHMLSKNVDNLEQNVGSLEKNLGSAQSEIEKKQVELQQRQQELQATKQSLQQTEGVLAQRQQELESTKLSLIETTGALLLQNQELEQTSTRVRFQRAMDEAVKKFPEDVVSAYQRENKLIFRLKQINFPSGKAELPTESAPLLADINEIIEDIGAELVAVEGHTDSIGSPEFNQKLSTDRAISVANYMAALGSGYQIGYVGFGESRPIASNETSEGRAINRRVDLVVTARKSVAEAQ